MLTARRQRDPCDEMEFVHDVLTPMIEPIERRTNCTARQCTTFNTLTQAPAGACLGY